MTDGTAQRLGWDSLPAALTQEISALLGSPVISAVSQTSGFSPGLAAIVTTDDGARAFVKAVSSGYAPVAHSLYRREAGLLPRLPEGVAAPALLGTVTHEDWFALVTGVVDGAQPSSPSSERELLAVLDAVHASPEVAGLGLPNAGDELMGGAADWTAVLGDHADVLPHWVLDNASELERLSVAAPERVRGNRLVHLDLRADNVLLDRTGHAWIVDWPSASEGQPWLDGVTMLLDARMLDTTADADRMLREHPLLESVDPESVDAVLARLAGMFLARSVLPSPPNMPTLRAFQEREGIAALVWLRARRFA
jgi:aminoglycoside phosphotransferase (APT) family kinase protein